MGRQLDIKNHCLLCLNTLNDPLAHDPRKGKILYERVDPGFSAVVRVCNECLGYLRGGNWPTEIYAKLTVDREVEGERAVKTLVEA